MNQEQKETKDLPTPWWARYLIAFGVLWYLNSIQNAPNVSGWTVFFLCLFAAVMMWELLFAIIAGVIAWKVLGSLAGLSTGTLLILWMLWLIYTKENK